ncbi:MAG: AAA family ATPase [Azoarcus sp.]|jgi:ABC-type taurine transport system ATPase subunit|nr:AAA family ATPase [Azoarcus sp.]
MLTRLTIRNFKLFNEVELDLGDRVMLIGPNNAGKTSALQALALWDIGVRRWIEKRGASDAPGKRDAPEKRPGVTINRKSLAGINVPAVNLLWRDRRTHKSNRQDDSRNPQGNTQNIFIDIIVEGISGGTAWECGMEFYYANEESLYCRALRRPEGRMQIPGAAIEQRIAYLPPMSGLTAYEDRLDQGSINARLGEGRTAEIMRNLCWQVLQRENGQADWNRLVAHMEALFGIRFNEPRYIAEWGQLVMSYRNQQGTELDISSSGRGQQQTLLLLAHMAANPGTVLLLDEPDAHLEILRQRQIYQVLHETAAATHSQIIAASHSEVLLNEAADRDIVIAFVGKPHRIDDRGAQVTKALKEIGFEHYYQAEETGWVLYLEGSTDLAILRAFARRLDHPAKDALERPFVHYVANQPRKAQEHFYGLKEAKSDLIGVAIYDRLEQQLPNDPHLRHLMWHKRELENYFCQRETLLEYAEAIGGGQTDDVRRQGDLIGAIWKNAMDESISEVESALKTLGKPSPWGTDIKASDDVFDSVFKNFYERLNLSMLMRKSDYYRLAEFVPTSELNSPEILEKLDAIYNVYDKAKKAQL